MNFFRINFNVLFTVLFNVLGSKSFLFIILYTINLPILMKAQVYKSENPFAHTYSIVAYDEETGEMGVAVQSHWFSVGTIVSWGEAGVGVVATQSFVNPQYGPDGLMMLKEGLSPDEIVRKLTTEDEGRAVRQLAVLNKQGIAASYTGDNCIKDAGNLIGKHYSVQANMMLNDKVWPAMALAFENSKGSLAERMLISLEAGQAAGGDIRGKQSAAILVVGSENTGKPWLDRKVDLRVDDHKEPLEELRRLLNVHTAYSYMNQGDLDMEHGDMKAALNSYSKAESIYPDNIEMTYWKAVTMANGGMLTEALPLFRKTFAISKNWKTLTKRIVSTGLLIVDEQDLKRILEE